MIASWIGFGLLAVLCCWAYVRLMMRERYLLGVSILAILGVCEWLFLEWAMGPFLHG